MRHILSQYNREGKDTFSERPTTVRVRLLGVLYFFYCVLVVIDSLQQGLDKQEYNQCGCRCSEERSLVVTKTEHVKKQHDEETEK